MEIHDNVHRCQLSFRREVEKKMMLKIII